MNFEIFVKVSRGNIEEKCVEDKALSTKDQTILKVVQITHHQGNVRYGVTRGIQPLCVSLITVSWTLFKSPGLWDKFNLYSTLVEERSII